MRFCRKILAAALCVLVLLPEPGSARTLWKRALLKMTEKYDDYEYPLHSHSSHYQKNDRCPPPPQSLPERACEVPSCRSDSECERHKRCCYNGCIYACLESVQPPPVLDWLVQPKPRWLGGNGWLLDGPEEVLQGTRHFSVFSVISLITQRSCRINPSYRACLGCWAAGTAGICLEFPQE
uniref:WAP four-disulfide core domain protein 1 n=1 Tax=Cyanistes caeruleus TaxID=156563 RepID=A0A8C0UE58_CYACU